VRRPRAIRARGVKRALARRRPRILVSLALTVLFVVVPAGVYAWGRTSSTFNVLHVQVVGAQRVSTEAALNLLEHRFVGRNLFTVSAADVARTLRPLVYLASARVDRHFPSTLIVRVREYRPGAYALWSGRWYLISDDGHALADLAAEKRSPTQALAHGPAHAKPRLPAVQATGPLAVRAAVSQPAILDTLALARALPAAIRSQVRMVRTTPAGLRVVMRDGLVLVVGSAEQLHAKTLSLQAVLSYYRGRHVKPTYVDVSLPDRPLAKPKLAALQ
jgi:cell division septal protein FtsQ